MSHCTISSVYFMHGGFLGGEYDSSEWVATIFYECHTCEAWGQGLSHTVGTQRSHGDFRALCLKQSLSWGSGVRCWQNCDLLDQASEVDSAWGKRCKRLFHSSDIFWDIRAHRHIHGTLPFTHLKVEFLLLRGIMGVLLPLQLCSVFLILLPWHSLLSCSFLYLPALWQ